MNDEIKPPRRYAAGLSADDLVMLNDEIAGMARAGLPLDQGLSLLAREMGGGRLQTVTADLATDLRAGKTLPEALERQSGRIPPYYASLVSAGVRTGKISEVLATLTVYARNLSDVRDMLANAAYYPVTVICLAAALFAFVCWFVVPQFEAIFVSFKMTLPLATRIMIALSHIPWYLWLVPPLFIVGVVQAERLHLRNSKAGRRAWTHILYSLPIVGTLIRSARLAAFTDLLSILLDYGIPLPEALALAGSASSDPVLAESVNHIVKRVNEGDTLGHVLKHAPGVPELVSWMAGVGEKRGSLAADLQQIAQMYRRQVNIRIHLLQSVLPPLLIIVTAAMLMGIFLVAVGLPLLGMLEGLSGGKVF